MYRIFAFFKAKNYNSSLLIIINPVKKILFYKVAEALRYSGGDTLDSITGISAGYIHICFSIFIISCLSLIKAIIFISDPQTKNETFQRIYLIYFIYQHCPWPAGWPYIRGIINYLYVPLFPFALQALE